MTVWWQGEAAETTLRELFAEVLNLTDVEADDDFFSLGGTSGQAASLTAAIGDVAGLPVRLLWLYENPTPAGLCRVLRQNRRVVMAPRPGRLEPPALFLLGMKGEREPRGFLVTHVVRRDPGGAPLMKFSDSAKVQACMQERRCQACGFAIGTDDWICFVGTPGDVEFAEPPLHLICASYSVGTCPHLLRQARSGAVQLVLCREYDYIGQKRAQVSDELEPHCRPTGQLLRLAPGDLREWLDAAH